MLSVAVEVDGNLKDQRDVAAGRTKVAGSVAEVSSQPLDDTTSLVRTQVGWVEILLPQEGWEGDLGILEGLLGLQGSNGCLVTKYQYTYIIIMIYHTSCTHANMMRVAMPRHVSPSQSGLCPSRSRSPKNNRNVFCQF